MTESEQTTVETCMPGAEGEQPVEEKPQSNFPPFVYKALSFLKIKFKAYFKDRGYLLIGAFLAMAIMYGLDIVMRIPPYGTGSVLVLDLNAQYVYFFEALRRAVYGNASFLYSFSRSMGGEFMGIYAYYLASPFSYIVALFPEGYMQEALTTIFILKTGLLTYTFGWYLHKTHIVRNRIFVITFGIFYAFTAYAIVQQHNTMWIDAVIWLPILTYGIEQLFKFGKFKIFVIFLALTIMSNFYIGYMVCIYVFLYFFAYAIGHSDKTGNPCEEKCHFFRSLFRIGFWSAVAIGVSLVIVWTAYYSLQFGKTTFSSPNWKPEFRFSFYQLLVKFFPGSYDSVTPSGLPFVYCGVLSLFLVPLFFLSPKYSNREKVGYALICVFLVMSFTISSADIFWHGFQKPNWLNYRYSFLLDFLLLVMAYKALIGLRQIGLKFFIIMGLGLTGIVFWLQSLDLKDKNFANLDGVIFSLICIGLYLIVVPACVKGKRKQLASVILLGITCLEVFLNGVTCILDLDDEVAYTHYNYYNDYNEGIREIMNITMKNDPTFYRMEKTTMRKKNDAFAFGMRGIAGSTSTLNQSTLDFLDSIGYPAASHWSYYYDGGVVNDALLGIKYVASNKAMSGSKFVETYVDSKDNYSAFLNPYALSIAFASSQDLMDYHAKDYPNAIERVNAIFTAILGSDTPVEIYKPVDVIGKGLTGVASGTAGEYYKYTKTSSSSEPRITFSFTSPATSDLVMYIGSDYPRKMTVLYDSMDKSMEDVETKRIMTLGKVEADVPSSVSIELDDNTLYILSDCAVLYYIDYDLLETVVEKLRTQELKTDAKSKDSKIIGTMHVDNDDSLIFTSIAYDQGWRVYVDGKRVETCEAADALLAFKADAGDHKVVLKYMPNCFLYGLIVTIASSVFFICVCIFWDKLMKVKVLRVLFSVEGSDGFNEELVSDDYDVAPVVEEEYVDEEYDPELARQMALELEAEDEEETESADSLEDSETATEEIESTQVTEEDQPEDSQKEG